MQRDSKCGLCGRFYRGEGYEGVCTKDCFFVDQYSKKFKKPVKRNVLYKKSPHSYNAVNKANERWFNNESPRKRDKKEINKTHEAFEKKHLNNEWMGRQYKAVRG